LLKSRVENSIGIVSRAGLSGAVTNTVAVVGGFAKALEVAVIASQFTG
jgi:hypothetical protein